jgi:hypothetical protein
MIGQAARHTGRLLRIIAEIALALLVILAIGVGTLAWRLKEGPLELPWLARRLESTASSAAMHLSVGTAALAWEGFSGGADRPLDIRLTDVSAIDADGTHIADIPKAAVTLSTRWLLLGHVVPISLEVDGLRLAVVRAEDGTVTIATGPQTQPAAGSSKFLDQILELRRVHLWDAAVSVVDRQFGLTWQAPQVSFDLRRPAPGELAGTAEVALVLGDQQVHLTADAAPRRDEPGTIVHFHLTPLTPAAVASFAPALAPLSTLDVPVRFSGSADLDTGFALTAFTAEARLASGRLIVGNGGIPVVNGLVDANGTPGLINLRLERLELAPRESGPFTIVQGTAQARRNADRVEATLGLDIDQVAFADLPVLWPEGIGGPGSRRWVTANITGGIASNGHVEVSLQAGSDFSKPNVVSLAGGIDGHDLTVHFLRPLPPIEHGEARLSLTSPDQIDIDVRSGRQGALTVRGNVRLTGINADDQYADITANIAGPLADAIAVLKQPRLKLFAHRAFNLQGATGNSTADLAVPHLPLRDQLSMDDIQVRASGNVMDAHLDAAIDGKPLDQGNLSWEAGNDGMKLNGAATLAGIPAQLDVQMDFRAGPPNQVLQKISVSGTADARQLASVGLDLSDTLAGPATLQATLQSRRDGRGEASIRADLAASEVRVTRLNWKKPAARPATAEAHVLLDNDRVAQVDRLQIAGAGIDVQGQMDFSGGAPAALRLSRLRLDPSTDARGEVRWPARPGTPWLISASGASIDATGEFSRNGERQPKSADDKPGSPWTIDAAFDRVVLGPERAASAVKLHAESDGRITRQLRLSGQTEARAPFSLTIAPEGRGRRLSGEAADAGGLLRGLDVFDKIEGGRLTLTGSYDDSIPAHRLTGRAEITDFHVRNAPALGKILQAMTLYGLVQALQSGGLAFSHLEAPFKLADDVLGIDDARAYSASLGMTAKGRIDLARNVCDVQGTIVPAYFFNSLLGSIPFVGRLFAPERGGGVFAATYSIAGNCDDPRVGVNPLAALTPGFLRGLFGMFPGSAEGSPRPPPSGPNPRQ